jgi:CRISPR-associated protein Cas5d
MKSSIILAISGDYVLFSRPEMEVERVSYDVITPSADCGILETIMVLIERNQAAFEEQAA